MRKAAGRDHTSSRNYLVFIFCINASCNTFEKLMPSFSASTQSQYGMVQFFFTAL